MKKIGIISIYDNNNYGNRLQNYAVQQVLKKIDCEPETIINWPETNQPITRIEKIKKNTRRKLSGVKKAIKGLIHQEEKRRYECFKSFNKKFVQISKDSITYCNARKMKDKYDYFIVGSDQVWNPNFGRLSDIDLLTFSKREKNIAFSASFGISSISETNKEKCKKAFTNFKSISVREDAGKNIIEQLGINEQVEVIIDPTMMLNAKEWDKVILKPKQLKTDNYILNYFLGNLSKERKQEIQRVAKENNCKIINILDIDSGFFSTGPSEFLYLIKNAFLVCTDSFHSCVFSILFNRPFLVFDREDNVVSMNSRIDTLLSKFLLEDRKYVEKIKKEQLVVDYEKSYEILDKERTKAIEFLRKVIE